MGLAKKGRKNNTSHRVYYSSKYLLYSECIDNLLINSTRDNVVIIAMRLVEHEPW